MRDSLACLKADPDFCKRVVGLRAPVPAQDIRPLDPMLEHFQHFTTVRRREARVASVEKDHPALTVRTARV